MSSVAESSEERSRRSEDERMRVARTWLRYHRAESDHRFWAVSRVTDLVHEDPDELWAIIQHLVKLADTEELLCDIGAGPLEGIVRYHGNEFIQRIESMARSDEKFAKALGCVWAFESDCRSRVEALLQDLGRRHR